MTVEFIVNAENIDSDLEIEVKQIINEILDLETKLEPYNVSLTSIQKEHDKQRNLLKVQYENALALLNNNFKKERKDPDIQIKELNQKINTLTNKRDQHLRYNYYTNGYFCVESDQNIIQLGWYPPAYSSSIANEYEVCNAQQIGQKRIYKSNRLNWLNTAHENRKIYNDVATLQQYHPELSKEFITSFTESLNKNKTYQHTLFLKNINNLIKNYNLFTFFKNYVFIINTKTNNKVNYCNFDKLEPTLAGLMDKLNV